MEADVDRLIGWIPSKEARSEILMSVLASEWEAGNRTSPPPVQPP